METDTAVIVFVHEETEVEFHWHGGAYIEVGYVENRGLHSQGEVGKFVASDVINVWDDARGRSRFELQADAESYGYARPFRVILELFEARCREYMNEGQPENEEDAQ